MQTRTTEKSAKYMAETAKKPIFELISHFLRTYPLRSLVVLVALLVAGLVETIGIGALLPLLNVILENENAEPNFLTEMIGSIFSFFHIEQNLLNLLTIIVITIALKALINFMALKIVAFSSVDITTDLRINLIKALMQAKWQYYSTLPIGKSSNAIATEAESAGQFYTLAGKTFASLIQASIYTAIAFLVDWKISLTAIVIGCVAAFLFKFLINMARSSGKDYALYLNNLLARLNESLSGAKALKAMDAEENFIDLLKKDIHEVQKARKKTFVSNLALSGFQEPLLVSLIAVGLFITHTYTAYPITELLLITFLFYRLIGQANLVQRNYQKTVALEGAVNSILQATDEAKNNAEKMTGKSSVTLSKEIKLDNVTLAYDDHTVCEGLNDNIPAKKITVIFGPSGIGKSTLLDAVLGLHTPKAGNVHIDGNALTKIDIKQWRHKVGYVPQDTFLFHDTIYQNITMGDDNITEEDATNALKAANAWDFVSQLDDGLDHIVGERGGKLSGGQKQRIAMARALARKPELLILDEATTGLDKESEQAILSALTNMLPNITVIAISHDPEILDIANHVIRLEKQA